MNTDKNREILFFNLIQIEKLLSATKQPGGIQSGYQGNSYDSMLSDMLHIEIS